MTDNRLQVFLVLHHLKRIALGRVQAPSAGLCFLLPGCF